MLGNIAMRFAAALVVASAAAVPLLATAQEWSVKSGATARGEYNDNYFFTPDSRQSAFIASVSPFVTAARRTETSEVSALLAVGANRVWGPSPTSDYVSGRFGLDGSLRNERSTWTGNASFFRAPALQSELTPTGSVLRLAYTSTAAASGAYTYALDERWSLGTSAGGYANRYRSVESGGTSSSNRGYTAGANVGYAYSDRIQFISSVGFSHDASNAAHSDAITATLGVVHQFSPQLTISAAVGGFWSDSEATQNAGAPVMTITTSDKHSDNGYLYGGNINYVLSERTQFTATLSENLAPSSTGTLSKNDIAGASLWHRFSDRLTGRLGASYTRTSSVGAPSHSFTNNYYQGEIGVSYLLAERWKLDAGYRYAGAKYSPDPFEPKSRVVFLSVGYNWSGASFTDWVGRRPDTQGLSGAGPVLFQERSPRTAGLPGAPTEAESPYGSPFDRFPIP